MSWISSHCYEWKYFVRMKMNMLIPRNPRCVQRKKGDDKLLVDTVGGAQSDVNIVSIFK